MSRQATDGGSVLSFTFLDVLMCTMGSLLLLLVVFGVIAKKSTRARREGEDSRISLTALSAPSPPPPGAAPAPAEDPNKKLRPDAAELAKQLEKVRSEQADLERLRTEAAERRRQEAARITHLEDHERRLEHELGKLHVTLQALEATEQKQNVDQEQAEAEAKKLKELIDETEKRLDEMRKNAGDKSYAIVPYKGANGTFRRPVFIECTADAVTIQPEGIRLTVEDFDGPLRSGNPLAAAVRAAHEELNNRAAAAGQTDLPDPYPLLIVRPDGAAAYAAALDAIRSWDSDYGYEFVEADWKLKYPEPDPRLSQVMAHAVDEARQRQALLARVAPRRYASRLAAGGAGMGGGGSGDGGGVGLGGGFESLGGGAGDRIGDHASDGSLNGGAGGNPLRSGGGQGGAGGNFMDEFDEAGAAGGGAGGGAGGSLVANTDGNGPGGIGGSGSGPGTGQVAGGGMGGSPGANGAVGGRYGGTGGAGTTPPYGAPPQRAADGSSAADDSAAQLAGQPGGGAGAAGTEGASGAAGSTSGGAGQSQGASGGGASGGDGGSASTSGGGAAGSGASASSNAMAAGAQGIPPMQMNNRRRGSSAADKRGVNWANAEASRNAAAITRPIKVQVNQDQILVIDADGRPADSGAISFKQPVDGVMDGLAGAVQRQVTDWGLAGDGMYWRPTLVVSVAPGAERQAQRVSELLENSGFDVRLPQATASAAGGSRATR